MRVALRAVVLSAVPLPFVACSPAPEPISPPAVTTSSSAAPSPVPSAVPSTTATAAAEPSPPSSPPTEAPPPPAGKMRLAMVLRGHWSTKPKGTIPATIEIPGEWGIRKISESITSLEPCAQNGILGGLRVSAQPCAGKGEAACLEENTLPAGPGRTRIGKVEDLGPSRRFAMARFTKGSGLVVVEGSAAVYDPETDQAAVCSFETLEHEKAGQEAYSAACRTLLIRPAGVTATDPAEKQATPGGFPATNADAYPDGPAIIEAARAFVGAAARNDMAGVNKILLTSALCKTKATHAGKPFAGAACEKEAKDAQELFQMFLKKLPPGFEPGQVATIFGSGKENYHVEVYGVKTPCEKPQKVIIVKLSNGFRAVPLPSLN